jgi:phosphatidylinositol alpha-1,6-mannosyltransferase
VSTRASRRLLTIGHSYVVGLNRRLAHEMAIAGGDSWQVTAVAPQRYRGDLGPIDVSRGSSEKNDLRTVRAVYQRVPHLMRYQGLSAAVEGRWDVVHCWEEPFVAAGAQIARAIRPDARFIVATFQNLNKRYPWPLSRFERTTMARADGWVAFGQSIEETLAARTEYARRPRRVIPPGVDVARFTPDPAAGAHVRRQLGWAEDAVVVGFLGRFVPEKGLRILCAALERLRDPWHAMFVGGGPLESELRQFERQHAPAVRVITGIEHDRVPEWLNAMSIACIPSQTTSKWREQFGRVLIETMACGVPVIATDSGEIPFVVGSAGTIVREGDAAALAGAIERMIGDADERRRLAAAGLDRARTRFAWPVVARAHLEFFDALLARETSEGP